MIACVAVFCTMGIQAQNWDINTLHKINSMDGKFVRNYSKAFSRSAPYISVGVPVAMAIYAGIGKDKELLKDAVYIGTSVAEAVVLTYGIKHMIGRERPYDRYPGRVYPYSTESSPSFPSGHTAGRYGNLCRYREGQGVVKRCRIYWYECGRSCGADLWHKTHDRS